MKYIKRLWFVLITPLVVVIMGTIIIKVYFEDLFSGELDKNSWNPFKGAL